MIEPRMELTRDVIMMRAAFDAWFFSMPAGWQDSYTNQGRLLVAFTHGWDARMAHDMPNGDDA
jgi:hypothetical protein